MSAKASPASPGQGAPVAPLFSICSGTETMAAFGKLLDAHCSEGETLWRREEAQRRESQKAAQQHPSGWQPQEMTPPCRPGGVPHA